MAVTGAAETFESLDAELRAFVREHAEKLGHPREPDGGDGSATTVLFTGRVDAGKSSLINALRRASPGTAAWATVSPEPDTTKVIQSYPFGDGAVLLDSPGIISRDGHHLTLDDQAFARATLVVYVMSAVSLEKAEVEFLARVRSVGKDLLLVLNKFEILQQADLEQVIAHHSAAIAGIFGSQRPGIHTVSARLYLDALEPSAASPEAERDRADSRVDELRAEIERFLIQRAPAARETSRIDVLSVWLASLRSVAAPTLTARAREELARTTEAERALGDVTTKATDRIDLLLDRIDTDTQKISDKATQAKDRDSFEKVCLSLETECLQVVKDLYDPAAKQMSTDVATFQAEHDWLSVTVPIVPEYNLGTAAGAPPPPPDTRLGALKEVASCIASTVQKSTDGKMVKYETELAQLQTQLAKKWVRKGPLKVAIEKVEQSLEGLKYKKTGLEMVGSAVAVLATVIEQERKDQERLEMDSIIRNRLKTITTRERTQVRTTLLDWRQELQRRFLEKLSGAKRGAKANAELATVVERRLEEFLARCQRLKSKIG